MSLPRFPNPWRTHSVKTVFENPWFKVDVSDTTNPKGDPTDYAVVRFKNRAVGIIPYAEGHIWMVGQTRFALDTYSWEMPEGGCPPDEAIEACAARELKEEAGITARTLTPLFEAHTSNSVTDEWGQVFLATGLSFGEPELEDSEDITLRKLPLKLAYDYVEAGEITDLLTIAAIYKLMLLQAQKAL